MINVILGTLPCYLVFIRMRLYIVGTIGIITYVAVDFTSCFLTERFIVRASPHFGVSGTLTYQ